MTIAPSAERAERAESTESKSDPARQTGPRPPAAPEPVASPPADAAGSAPGGEADLLALGERRRYLDMAAGVAVCALGHAHPRLTATIAAQAGRLMHTSNYFYNRENLLL